MAILAGGKSLSSASGLASMKVATSPENGCPSTAVVTAVAVAVIAASATLMVVLLSEVEAPSTSLTVTTSG